MKTATVADLRNNFRLVSSWIEHGETVQIIKRGRAFAQLTTLGNDATLQKAPKPDVMARLDEVWGDRVFSLEEVAAMREAELEGEEG
jgi:antitoxin (DNA-binding transcriptional repressor) of toxin-antitoxin stability system